MLKKFLFIALIACGTTTVLAQYEGTEWKQRIGHAKDSVENQKRFERFNEDFSKNRAEGTTEHWTRDSYKAWRYLFDHAPFCDHFLYLESNGGLQMFEELIKKEEDPAVRAIYFQDALEAYDFRLKNLKAFNSFMDEPFRRTQGEMLAWKAHFYLKMKDYIPEKLYDYKLCRDMYADAIRLVSEQDGGIGMEFQANAFLPEYFEACLNLYKKQGGEAYELFLEDYETCYDICQGMVDRANAEPDSVKKMDIFRRFYFPQVRIDSLYAASGLGTPDSLDAYYGSRLAAHRRDEAFLDKAIHNMFYHNILLGVQKNGSTPKDKPMAFYNYCDAAYAQKPTFENCIGMGYMNREDGMERDEWINFFQEAVNLAKTDNEKGFTHRLIATELNYFWRNNEKIVAASRENAKKRKDYDPNDEKLGLTQALQDQWWDDLRVADINYEYAAQELARSYEKAACHLNRATVQYYMRQYDQAEQSLLLAKQTDVLVGMQNGGLQDQIDNAKAIKKANEEKAKRNKAAAEALKRENERAWREYNEYLARKAAEEAFWKGGH